MSSLMAPSDTASRRRPEGAAVKHRHVDTTLITAERFAPFDGACDTPAASRPQAHFAHLADADDEPLPPVTRALMHWDGPEWAEIDAGTGDVIARGSTETKEPADA